MIDFTKPVETRDGRVARVICTTAEIGKRSVVALVGPTGKQQLISYYDNGRRDLAFTTSCDLLQSKTPLPTCYVNFYRRANGEVYVDTPYYSRVVANTVAHHFGNVKVATVELNGFVGEGLPVPPSEDNTEE